MLQHLYIKNIALIDEISIDFDENLNILTGETGAGKSIIIDSINLALGTRINKHILRKDCDNGLIELLFKSKDLFLINKLKEYGILCENGEILLVRSINSKGRSISRINGQVVTSSMLKNISSFLIDIHGQHEHQSLLNESKHINILDRFCGNDLKVIKNKYNLLYNERKKFIDKLDKYTLDEHERERKINLLQYESDEIAQADLKPKEEDELKIKQKKLRHVEKLLNGCHSINQAIASNSEQSIGCSEIIGNIVNTLNSMSSFDDYFVQYQEQFENISVVVEDLARDIRQYGDNIELDAENLNSIDDRLNLIYNLKSKYGNTIKDIIQYKKQLDKELEVLVNNKEYISNIRNKIDNIETLMRNVCDEITLIRRKMASIIEKKVTTILTSLQFEYALFKIEIVERNQFSLYGLDEVKFLISTNVGEELKSLSKVASGGEMSRIMLALKTVLAEYDEIPTLIFDEIDTGISGRTAQKVAEKLSLIARYHQVICITHLPQIAAMADQHYLISKKSQDNETITRIKQLKENEIVNELCRLLGGTLITETTKKSAMEIKIMATNFKKNL